MKRVKLTVAYDGTNYCGWQVQPNGITVQEVLNQCLSEFTGENIETANRKILKLRQDENSVLGALIVAIMVLPIFFPVNYKFKINLCVDALEDGTLDVSGDCMMDNRENTRKEFSLKDMQEV